jgi:hypothetical protein
MGHEVLMNELKLLHTNSDQYPSIGVRNLLKTLFADHCRDKASQLEDWLNAYHVTFKVMQIEPGEEEHQKQLRPCTSAVEVSQACYTEWWDSSVQP